MSVNAVDELNAMFARVAENWGESIIVKTPGPGGRNPATGAKAPDVSTQSVLAVPGRIGQSLGSFGRARANVNEGVFTVRADSVYAKPTDQCWIERNGGDDVRWIVSAVDEACGGAFYVITVRRAAGGA